MSDKQFGFFYRLNGFALRGECSNGRDATLSLFGTDGIETNEMPGLSGNDLQQIGWMLVDFASRVDEEGARTDEHVNPNMAHLEGYRDGVTGNIPSNPYPSDNLSSGFYSMGYKDGVDAREEEATKRRQGVATQCEHVDPDYGRCNKDWGHDSASGGGHVYYELRSSRAEQKTVVVI